MAKSECCGATITASLADGVLSGWCSQCHQCVRRVNPLTGKIERLRGESPWDKDPHVGEVING